jgi:GH15 family glucan-1,4-alpha-glucosidase
MAKRIEDYALIGDCESAALISRDGSIDWLCWPRFDSGALFCRLLGTSGNGRWRISPAARDATVTRRYRGNSLILETRIETSFGSATITDFMPHRDGRGGHLVRLVQGQGGEVELDTEFVLRFDYGLIVPWITQLDGEGLKAVAGPDKVILRTPVPLEAKGLRHHATFTVQAGETIPFVLSYGQSFRDDPLPLDAVTALRETQMAWDRWRQSFNLPGTPYSDAVLRSLITLKGLTYPITGGIVAAPTTSLPEEMGGVRNWDYRYCWLRDATFTLLALLNSGFWHEAQRFQTWLRRALAGSPKQIQIVYGLAGERRLVESEIPWLPGFNGSKPVRVGNAASGQLQLDVFGEVMDALFHSYEAGLDPDREAWPLMVLLLDHLEEVWRLPDEGLWEVRGGRRHFTHSKVMAWVAFDRAVKMVERYGLEGPVESWKGIRQEIHEDVCKHGFNNEWGAFVQSYGSDELDASALLIALVEFLPASDPRIRSTVEAIGKHLSEGRLIRRYKPEAGTDGIKGNEGCFLACSFWYADNLILLGRKAEARDLFEYLLGLCNDVGLLSEEYDPEAGRMLGNFPQAFSHVALVNTAHNLIKAGPDGAPSQRGE